MLLLLHICWCYANRLLLPGVKDGTRTRLGTDQQAIYAVQWPLFEIPFVLHFFQVHQLCRCWSFFPLSPTGAVFLPLLTLLIVGSHAVNTQSKLYIAVWKEQSDSMDTQQVVVFWCSGVVWCVVVCLFIPPPPHFTLTSITLIFHSLSLNVSLLCCSFF